MAEHHHHSPLAQFQVHPLAEFHWRGLDLSFTNSALFMVIAVTAIALFLTLATRKAATVPSRWQLVAEMGYEFVANMLRDNVGKDGMKYFPFVFSLFMFVLITNLLGMMPYGFTVTSHISITFALALVTFLGITAIGFLKHGLHFLGFFLPKGTPLWMAPLMIFIELFAYLARPVSLSIRLAANMMAGHTMLKIIAGFVIMMGFLGGWLPLAFLVALTGFEIFVAVLQAYIFAVLICVYLNDAVHMH